MDLVCPLEIAGWCAFSFTTEGNDKYVAIILEDYEFKFIFLDRSYVIEIGKFYIFIISPELDELLSQEWKDYGIQRVKSIKNVSSAPNLQSRYTNRMVLAHQIASMHPELLRPPTVLRKDKMMHSPFDVSGQLLNLHIDANSNRPVWAELLGRSHGGNRGDVIYIFFSRHLQVNSQCPTFARGEHLLFRHVYPVYLWGRLHGFAMTIRSTFTSTILPNTSEKRPMMTSYCTTEFETNCTVFVAWWVYLCRRLTQCIRVVCEEAEDKSMTIKRCCESITHSLSPGALLNFKLPQMSPLSELCDSDVGPLYSVRGGQDIDWLCSMLPEVWSCTMFRHFAENAVLYRKKYKKKHSPAAIDSESNEGFHFQVFSEPSQGSEIRHESYSCRHDIIVVGNVIDICVNSDIECLVLGDLFGEELIVFVVDDDRWTTDTEATLFASKMVPLSNLTGCTERENYFEARSYGRIGSVKNPIALIECNPHHNEQSAQVIAIVQRRNVTFIESCGVTNCRKHTLPSSSTPDGRASRQKAGTNLSAFLSSHLVPTGGIPGGTPRTPCPVHSIFHDRAISFLSVRQVLMMDINHRLPEKGCIHHIYLCGLVIRKEILTSSECSPSANRRKRSRVDRNDLVILRDSLFPDIIRLYLPSATARLCIPGVVVHVSDASLKMSANGKRLYLELGNAPSLDIVGLTPPHQIETLLNPYLNIPSHKIEIAALNAYFAGSDVALPSCTISNMMESRRRNRCWWSFIGHISVIREIEVFVRCKVCYIRAVKTTASVWTCLKHGIQSQSKIMSTTPRELDPCCEMWWGGVVAVDDGSAEALMYVEGIHLHEMLSACYRAGEEVEERSSDHGSGERKNTLSFSEFRCSAETLASSVGIIKYHHSFISHYVANEDSFDIPLEENSSLVASSQPPIWPSSSSRELSSSDSSAIKAKGISLIRSFVKSCKLSLSMQLVVKVLTSQSDATDKDASGFGSRNIRKIKVQRSGTPGYLIDNIEYISETYDTLKLRCLQFRSLSSSDIAIKTWQLWHDTFGGNDF